MEKNSKEPKIQTKHWNGGLKLPVHGSPIPPPCLPPPQGSATLNLCL